MLSQFFLKAPVATVACAWGGLLVVVAYSIFSAYVKAEVNAFYSNFYDLLQEAGSTPEYGSGEDWYPDHRARIWHELARFGVIVAPLVVASPVAKWVRSAWAFAWRSRLMHCYLDAWDSSQPPLEGASQRLHEDSQRFCSALQGCLALVLDALCTLVVFSPILTKLSADVEPPVPLGVLRPVWLVVAAVFAAAVGLGGAMVAGRYLVGLEVANQRVEAHLRRDLVVLETTPALICGPPRGGWEQDSVVSHGTAPSLFFQLTLKRLRENYHALFRHFTALNLWLSAFDQFMVILPYLLAAPLLFATEPERRITLGTLVQVSNSFEKVFSSLSIVSENWGSVNEFRSVLVRLREFEAKVFRGRDPPGGNCLVPSSQTRSDEAQPRSTRRDTEMVVVDGGPVEVSTTYGNEVFDMRV